MVEVEITAFQLDPPRAPLKVRFFLVRKTEAHPGEFSEPIGDGTKWDFRNRSCNKFGEKNRTSEKKHWMSKSDFVCVCGGFYFCINI